MIGNKKHYLIAGASGLIGTQLLDLLLNDEDTGKVTSLVRSSTGMEHPKLNEKIIAWDSFTESDLPQNCDVTFICLGTTMAKAGSKDAFRKVDFEYVAKLSVFSQRKGISQIHIVSAAGANANSRIFYNKVKGRMEDEVVKLDKVKSVYFYRPSMLLGEREEFRMGETIGKVFMKAFNGITPKSYKAIYDVQVAYAMLYHSRNSKKGKHVVSNADMHELMPA